MKRNRHLHVLLSPKRLTLAPVQIAAERLLHHLLLPRPDTYSTINVNTSNVVLRHHHRTRPLMTQLSTKVSKQPNSRRTWKPIVASLLPSTTMRPVQSEPNHSLGPSGCSRLLRKRPPIHHLRWRLSTIIARLLSHSHQLIALLTAELKAGYKFNR